MPGLIFMQWGLVHFQIWPLNINEYDHSTGSAYAKKDIVESIPHREWTGEDDETIRVQGKIFPYRIGGWSALQAFENQRREGEAHSLVRGSVNGANPLGWYVCESLVRRHNPIGNEGIGRVVAFEALFARVDIARADIYYSSLYGTLS